MDIRETVKTVEWLDAQRSKDKKLILGLEERLKASVNANAELEQRIKQLESLVTGLQPKFDARLNGFTDEMSKVRTEFNRQIDEVEIKREQRWREQERIATIHHEATTRSVTEIRKRFEPIPKILAEVESRRDDSRRFLRQLDDTQTNVRNLMRQWDEAQQAITTSLEAYKVDNKRIIDVGGEVADLRRRIDEFKARSEIVEDLARRAEPRINELIQLETERRLAQSAWIEQQSIANSERQRAWSELEDRAKNNDGRFMEFSSRMDVYAETHREMERALTAFNENMLRIEQRLKEASEIQRMTADRMKNDWETFRGEDQKRWTTHLLMRDEQWREEERRRGKLVERMAESEEIIAGLQDEFKQLRHTDHQRLLAIFGKVREYLAEYDQSLTKVR